MSAEPLPRQDHPGSAQGLAQAAALAVADQAATTFVEIDPHAMPSEMLGQSQRNVVRLLRDVVPELARDRPHVAVLIDEVDSFAVCRDLVSFETNPVDVPAGHRRRAHRAGPSGAAGPGPWC